MHMGKVPLRLPHTQRIGFRAIAAYLAILFILLTAVPGVGQGQQHQSAAELLEKFEKTRAFGQQLDVAEKIVETRDTSLLLQLESWLSHEDRHLRGNAAFIFAALGDDRGLDVINKILTDRSDRPEGQGIPGDVGLGYGWSLQRQIAADRYYAVHLIGQLKDRRSVPVLVALMHDEQVNYKAAWALGQIGGESAVQGLIATLDNNHRPEVLVTAIEAVANLNAEVALPSLRRLLADNDRTHFGEPVSVAEVAQSAITKLQHP